MKKAWILICVMILFFANVHTSKAQVPQFVDNAVVYKNNKHYKMYATPVPDGMKALEGAYKLHIEYDGGNEKSEVHIWYFSPELISKKKKKKNSFIANAFIAEEVPQMEFVYYSTNQYVNMYNVEEKGKRIPGYFMGEMSKESGILYGKMPDHLTKDLNDLFDLAYKEIIPAINSGKGNLIKNKTLRKFFANNRDSVKFWRKWPQMLRVYTALP